MRPTLSSLISALPVHTEFRREGGPWPSGRADSSSCLPRNVKSTSATDVGVCEGTHVCLHVPARACVCMHECVPVCSCVHVHVCLCACVYIYTCMCVCLESCKLRVCPPECK